MEQAVREIVDLIGFLHVETRTDKGEYCAFRKQAITYIQDFVKTKKCHYFYYDTGSPCYLTVKTEDFEEFKQMLRDSCGFGGEFHHFLENNNYKVFMEDICVGLNVHTDDIFEPNG